MVEIGYALCSEEHGPKDLIRYAQLAEQAGFRFAFISDHYLPWLEQQGNSPFAWSVLGAIAQATSGLRLGTQVTCPLIRYHPAIIAQAAATVGMLAPGRFSLGVGAGENLNEHILGQRWPEIEVRHEMLAEAVDIIRQLWNGDWVSYYGSFYTIENARLYSLPDPTPPIYIAVSGTEAAELAGEIADGLISTGPSHELVQQYAAAGGNGKPTYAQLTVCWADTETDARRTAYKWWRQTAVPGALPQVLPLPRYFERLSRLVTEDELARSIVTGPDPERHIDAIKEFAGAGFSHVYIHQIGPDQEGFFRFYEREVLPNLR